MKTFNLGSWFYRVRVCGGRAGGRAGRQGAVTVVGNLHGFL